jgi:hypothetical protein
MDVMMAIRRSFEVDEQSALELAAIVLKDAGKPLGPASEFLPDVPAVNGERLLTDADWMTDRHRQAAQKYKGDPLSLGTPRAPAAGPQSARTYLIPRSSE